MFFRASYTHVIAVRCRRTTDYDGEPAGSLPAYDFALWLSRHPTDPHVCFWARCLTDLRWLGIRKIGSFLRMVPSGNHPLGELVSSKLTPPWLIYFGLSLCVIAVGCRRTTDYDGQPAGSLPAFDFALWLSRHPNRSTRVLLGHFALTDCGGLGIQNDGSLPYSSQPPTENVL